ncbi:MAG: RNA methyltransferase [Flammeovirgaceae bacterium]|nr:RNA methyltransferase [Flammeovirgaceae bacterium]MDW8288516.1 RNA methyltransferase [Flammeovirgaceae bacterium]
MKKITSLQNSFVKQVVTWQEKAKERKRDEKIVIEGLKEIEKALRAGYLPETMVFCAEKISLEEIKEQLPFSVLEQATWIEVSLEVFAKMAYREDSKNLLMISTPKNHELSLLRISSCPLLIVLEAVEKPGNLGAILRTADAAGVDALIVCDNQTDLYNPNVIRASVGCVFTVPVAVASSSEAIRWLKEKNIQICCTALSAAKPYHLADFRLPTAIVLGTEATGLTTQWLQASDANIIIPMSGYADSLNVSTSCAIVVFEAKRQRNFR